MTSPMHAETMRISVWVDDWQMQCCGEPFAVGHEVSWTLKDTDGTWLEAILGAGSNMHVDKAEEHHGGGPDGVAPVTGTVTSIHAAYWRSAPQPDGDPKQLYPVPGSGVVTAIHFANGRTPDRSELKFAGYIVGLMHE
ncbi:DUF6578 domain-containing protein [Cryptosporangium japonicum]|uniref:Uncharacterized protein n=1 Tax=Cryptosporangium japonicum TaxID=80872 RepID=A0ABN0TKS6_9ACTN